MKTNGDARLQTIRAMALLLTGLGAVLSPAAGTNYAWTITAPNAVDYWTNSANWKPAGIPGSTTGDSAYLTNAVGNAYTSILNVSPVNTLTALTLSNGLGTACLVVTQGASVVTLAASTLTLQNGARLEIDAGGTVSNGPTFNWLGTSGQMVLNNGGTLVTTNVTLGNGVNGTAGQITSAAAPGGVWNFGSNYLRIASSSNSFAVQGVTLTNLTSLTVGNGAGVSNVMWVGAGAVVNCQAGAFIGQSGGSLGQTLIITNGGRLYAPGANGVIGNADGASNNTVAVVGTNSLFDTGAWPFNIGGNYVNAFGNSMVVSNGAQANTGGSHGGTYIGYKGAGNAVFVTGGGSLWGLDAAGLTIGGGAGTGNVLYVDNGAAVTNASTIILGAATGGGNSLTVTNGSQVWSSGALTLNGTNNTVMVANGSQVGPSSLSLNAASNTVTCASGSQMITTGNNNYIGSPGFGNTVVITGGGSFWNPGSGAINIGYLASSGNVLRVANGGVVSNGTMIVGLTGASGNSLIVTNGGLVWPSGACTVGSAASGNTADISGGGALLVAPGVLYVGNDWSTGNLMRVGNGGSVSNAGSLSVGYGGNSYHSCVSNTVVVTNGGVMVSSGVNVGISGSNSWGNALLVVNGGLLDASTLTVNKTPGGPVWGNSITNAGGIYQFPTATPAITLLSNGMVYITSGTIAFRGVTNADVRNATLLATNKMTWNGNNAFRLNNATNRNDASQSYVFDTGSATNYYRLEMVNGNTRYRGLATNSLTTGANGQMLCSNTAAVVDLTFTNNGTLTLVNSTLTFATNAVLNGTVVVDLNNLPSSGPLLAAQGNLTLGSSILQFVGSPSSNLTLMSYAGTRSGKFQVTGLPATYAVAYGAGANDAISLHAVPPSTVILFR